MLDKGVKNEKIKHIDDKVTIRNISIFYNLANLYNFSSLAETTLNYIQRCYTMVVKTQSFLELSFKQVAKIFSSSELNIHSEIEVFNAAINWLKHKNEERSKYAKQLLLTVRFHLFSDCELNCVLNNTSSFIEKMIFIM